jgi:hypothetical protein
VARHGELQKTRHSERSEESLFTLCWFGLKWRAVTSSAGSSSGLEWEGDVALTDPIRKWLNLLFDDRES